MTFCFFISIINDFMYKNQYVLGVPRFKQSIPRAGFFSTN
ncbi:hypothetical protein ALC62_05026 [Cyphomyrmex costatus]|uniref:Uncharacterized protein n=1 Tax=Cyphomyrmex costatus TaxID=456900 RepID=A0A195CUC4_9HYME|nr:hypothetical protein ALC62_05026 [Cyphomyrmex costatus]